jgi:hypothetical protein
VQGLTSAKKSLDPWGVRCIASFKFTRRVSAATRYIPYSTNVAHRCFALYQLLFGVFQERYIPRGMKLIVYSVIRGLFLQNDVHGFYTFLRRNMLHYITADLYTPRKGTCTVLFTHSVFVEVRFSRKCRYTL